VPAGTTDASYSYGQAVLTGTLLGARFDGTPGTNVFSARLGRQPSVTLMWISSKIVAVVQQGPLIELWGKMKLDLR